MIREFGYGKFVEGWISLKVCCSHLARISHHSLTTDVPVPVFVCRTVEPKTNVKSMLSSKNFRPYIYKYGEVVSRLSFAIIVN